MNPEPAAAQALTAEAALGAAARLLRNAEVETNLALMERIEALADSWVSIARLLVEKER